MATREAEPRHSALIELVVALAQADQATHPLRPGDTVFLGLDLSAPYRLLGVDDSSHKASLYPIEIDPTSGGANRTGQGHERSTPISTIVTLAAVTHICHNLDITLPVAPALQR